MKPLVLVGPPTVGKTLIGRMLAHHLFGMFYDTDQEMERIYGASICEFLPREGEPWFRAFEAQVLTALVSRTGFGLDSAVIATGGGIVEHKSNRLELQQRCRTICLFAPVPVLMARMEGDETRPLWSGPGGAERLRERLERRWPLYQEVAEVIVPVYGSPALDAPSLIVSRIIKTLTLKARGTTAW